MDWSNFLQGNFAAIIALVGVLIGFFGSLVKESLTKKLELEQKQLDSQKDYREKNLVTPIITFVDETLQLIDNAYWTALDEGPPNVMESLLKHRDKESMIKARIVAFDDALLSKSFDNLSLNYGQFWNYIREGNTNDAYTAKQSAQQNAGIIFDRVRPQLKKK